MSDIGETGPVLAARINALEAIASNLLMITALSNGLGPTAALKRGQALTLSQCSVGGGNVSPEVDAQMNQEFRATINRVYDDAVALLPDNSK